MQRSIPEDFAKDTKVVKLGPQWIFPVSNRPLCQEAISEVHVLENVPHSRRYTHMSRSVVHQISGR